MRDEFSDISLSSLPCEHNGDMAGAVLLLSDIRPFCRSPYRSSSRREEFIHIPRVRSPARPSCPVLSCPVLSCPVLSCPALPCPVMPLL